MSDHFTIQQINSIIAEGILHVHVKQQHLAFQQHVNKHMQQQYGNSQDEENESPRVPLLETVSYTHLTLPTKRIV